MHARVSKVTESRPCVKYLIKLACKYVSGLSFYTHELYTYKRYKNTCVYISLHSCCPLMMSHSSRTSHCGLFLWSPRAAHSSRPTGHSTCPCTCRSSSPLLLGDAFLRRHFQASPQRPAMRRRTPPPTPAMRPMSMPLSGEGDVNKTNVA